MAGVGQTAETEGRMKRREPPSSVTHCHAAIHGGKRGARTTGPCDAPGVIAYATLGALCPTHERELESRGLLELWDGRAAVRPGVVQIRAIPVRAVCAVCDDDKGPWEWDDRGRLLCGPCFDAYTSQPLLPDGKTPSEA
jgi:hypothetical protein